MRADVIERNREKLRNAVVTNRECDECGDEHVECILFSGGNGEVSGYSIICLKCLRVAVETLEKL